MLICTEGSKFLCRTMRSGRAQEFQKSKTGGGQLYFEFCSSIRMGLSANYKPLFSIKFLLSKFRYTCSIFWLLSSTSHHIYEQGQSRMWNSKTKLSTKAFDVVGRRAVMKYRSQNKSIRRANNNKNDVVALFP